MAFAITVFAPVVATTAIATAFTVLRFIARRVTRVSLWWDDYMAAAAFLFAIAWVAVVLRWNIDAGLGLPLQNIDRDHDEVLEEGRLLLWNAEIFYAFSLAFSKFSILGFYWRLFKTYPIRMPIIVLVVCSAIWLTIRTFMAIFHCIPVEAFWDHTIENARCDIDDSKFFFGTVLVHLILDIGILALPVFQVRSLQLRLGQKVAVTGLFMFGILVCVASVVVLVESAMFNPQTEELPKDIAAIMIWATVEVNLAIVSACLPMMRPIFRKIMPGSMLASDPSKPYSGHGTHGTNKGAIKLSSLNRGKDGDEASSTRQLADTDIERTSTNSNEFGNGNVLGASYNNHHTFISGHGESVESNGRPGKGQRGIHVKNEMTVSYEPA